VEAVIMLPVFILILFGVLFAARMAETRQAALMAARACAWRYADAGCRPVEGCEQVIVASADTGIDNDIRQRVEAESFLDTMTEIPLLGPAVEGIFGSAAVADAGRTVERPTVLGGGAIEIRGSYYLMCNERERTLGGLLREAFCSVADAFPAVCGSD